MGFEGFRGGLKRRGWRIGGGGWRMGVEWML